MGKKRSFDREQKQSENGKDERKEASSGEKKRCFNCGLPDHLGKDCRRKRTVRSALSAASEDTLRLSVPESERK